jgi:hypothetical protein
MAAWEVLYNWYTVRWYRPLSPSPVPAWECTVGAPCDGQGMFRCTITQACPGPTVLTEPFARNVNPWAPFQSVSGVGPRNAHLNNPRWLWYLPGVLRLHCWGAQALIVEISQVLCDTLSKWSPNLAQATRCPDSNQSTWSLSSINLFCADLWFSNWISCI